MRRLLAYTIASLLLATVAHGEARDVDSELLEMFDRSRPIMETDLNAATIVGAFRCFTFNRYGTTVIDLCATTWFTHGYVPYDFVLTGFAVDSRLNTAVDSDFCTITLWDENDTLLSTDVPAFRVAVDTSMQNVIQYSYPTKPIIISEGTNIKLNIDEVGGDQCDSAIGNDPWLKVIILGYPLEEIK